MFEFKEEHEYDWPVVVEMPVDGGKHEKREFTARFRVVPTDEAEEVLGGQGVAMLPDREQVEDFLRRVLVGWRDVSAEGSGDLPFSDENLARMIRVPYVRRALYEAYGQSIAGRREKN